MTWIVKSPATGEEIGRLQETPVTEIGSLYRTAQAAFDGWSSTELPERMQYFQRLRHVIIETQEQIVKVISQSTGKIPVEALTTEVLTVAEAIAHIEKHATRTLTTHKVKTPITFVGKSSYVEYKPRGTILVISPWNFPFQLSMIPIAEALAGGNAVILKPSEVTPMVGVLIQDLFERAGFPAGVLQVAHGGRELGAALVENKPDYIHFTGSVRTGRAIQMEAAKQLIPTTLELGGKDPMIVFADANIERAVNGAMWGAFSNSGQVCMSVERLYVERSIYKKFVNLLVEKTKQLKQGAGPDDDVGSMTFPHQVQVIKEHVEQALRGGATLLTGEHPASWKEGSMFVSPMIITNVTQDMDIMQEETFGPLLPVMPFDTEEEAIRLANDTRFGLSASVWTSDMQRGKRLARKLIAGNAVINDVIITIANPNLPYGGVKEGGIGAYHGEVGLQTFCVRTSVMADRGFRSKELNWYPYKGKYEHLANLTKSLFGEKKNWAGVFTSFTSLLRK